ncbi:hypothetical protein HOY80DRAFT_135451 [Tuber brumale]|nr:hypothetical protein HOY80DRAFT_135451 [Tuber brumale]
MLSSRSLGLWDLGGGGARPGIHVFLPMIAVVPTSKLIDLHFTLFVTSAGKSLIISFFFYLQDITLVAQIILQITALPVTTFSSVNNASCLTLFFFSFLLRHGAQ